MRQDGRVLLVGVQEIAELLGVSRQRADQLSRQVGFPEPVSTLSHGRQRVWDEQEIRDWATAAGREMTR
jgi:predicted DNA-binding transcriptional regulator AlpA